MDNWNEMNCLSSLLHGNTLTCVKYVTWLQCYGSCYISVGLMFEVPAPWHRVDHSGPPCASPVACSQGGRCKACCWCSHASRRPASVWVSRFPVRATFSHHDPDFLYQEQGSSSSPQSNFFLGAFSYYEWRRTFSESFSDVHPRVRQRGDA